MESRYWQENQSQSLQTYSRINPPLWFRIMGTFKVSFAKSLNGKYTRMLRAVLNVPPNSRISNKRLYDKLQPISSIVRKRRLALTGHVARRNEPAEINHHGGYRIDEKRAMLTIIWQDRDAWKKFVIASPTRWVRLSYVFAQNSRKSWKFLPLKYYHSLRELVFAGNKFCGFCKFALKLQNLVTCLCKCLSKVSTR